ncbi:hypothetical protein INT44_006898 [Umbelopsis vinacea]|uniref:Glycosyltransferase family 49 protein n=1 Tax=Umbelopsis vinacea TaxID=44442 RepID=A0A8H7PJE6_9FUNG|nr:hypothetical protein INT44_006898 [Umbelopsis vinacea]
MSEKRLSGSRPSVAAATLPHRRGSLSINTATLATSTATSQSPISGSVDATISPRRTRGDHFQTWIPRTLSSSRTTPTLPHDKRSYNAHYRLPRLLRHRWIQFVILVYATFSVLLTFTHLCQWSFSEKPITEPPVHIEEWEPKRTYRGDDAYSVVDDMTMAMRFSKMFSKSLPGTIEYTKPYWQRAHVTPTPHDISLTTWVTDKNYDQLIRIAQMWNGPMSITLHIESKAPTTSPETLDMLDQIRLDLQKESSIVQYADIHLLVTPPSYSGALALSRNSDRNFARLFARTEFICYLPIDLVPATELRDTLERNFDSFAARLRAGDVFVVPTFAYITAEQVASPEADWAEQAAEDDGEPENVEKEQFMTLVHEETFIPRTKSRLLHLVETGAMGVEDRHWPIGSGPTDFNKWKNAEKLFAVEDYEFHYEPVVIESRNVQPWCSERFAENGAACLYATYLTGANFWILPHDFVVRIKEQQQTWLSSTETVIQNRLYAKFVWELCVHHARMLDAEGLWNTDKSRHAKSSCSRVINSWGKGLVGE